MNREEIYKQLGDKALKLADELEIELWVINFGTSLRFHIKGEWVGWWGGQKDIGLYRKQPSQKSINLALNEAEEWFKTLPERMKDYKKWSDGSRLKFAEEVNRRYQNQYNKKDIHSFLQEEMSK